MTGFETLAAVTLLSSAASAGLGAAQASQQARAQTKATSAAAAHQNALIRQAQEVESTRRREALKREQASARARLGARGTGSTGGSGEALIQGLQNASARRAAENDAASELRVQGSLLDAANRNRLALLEAAQRRQNEALRFGTSAATTLTNPKSWQPGTGFNGTRWQYF